MPVYKLTKLGFAIVVLASCSSFNIYTYPPIPVTPPPAPVPATQAPSPERVEGIREQVISTAVHDLCPRAVFSRLPATPEVPLKELNALHPDDAVGLDRIQLTHITQLRAYIQQLKSQINRERDAYLKACENYAQDQAGRHTSSRE